MEVPFHRPPHLVRCILARVIWFPSKWCLPGQVRGKAEERFILEAPETLEIIETSSVELPRLPLTDGKPDWRLERRPTTCDQPCALSLTLGTLPQVPYLRYRTLTLQRCYGAEPQLTPGRPFLQARC